MADGTVFRHGGVQFPLTRSTTKALLEDADPAIFHALDFFAAMLRIYIGPRLMTQARLEGLKLDDAVVKTLFVEPSPFLLAHQFKFPLLSLHRRTEENAGASASYDRDVSEWEFAYVLPSLTPRQTEVLHPILRAAARVITQAARVGRDPAYKDGASVWELAGIERARVIRSSYGAFEAIDENPTAFRAVVGKIQVVEVGKDVADTYETFDGVTLTVDHQAQDDTLVAGIVVASTHQGPTLVSIAPNLGSKAGGTTVTITGTKFRFGTPVRVLIGNVECTNATVLSDTSVRAVTASHDGYPDFMADVVVIADDTQQATLPAAFTFTSP